MAHTDDQGTPDRHRRGEIESRAALQRRLDQGQDLRGLVLQGLDLNGVQGLTATDVNGSIWLGCRFASDAQRTALLQRGALVFPPFDDLPYDPYRTELYSVEELMEGYEDGYTATRDYVIHDHARRERHNPAGVSLKEALAQRLHDHAIDDALAEFIADRDRRGVVGVMGGHGTARTDPFYREVVRTAWHLTREGYMVVTGGGPGVMEAANLGAWLAAHDDPTVIDRAIDILSAADTMSGGAEEGTPEHLEAVRAYVRCAREVVDQLHDNTRVPPVSLAIPTWFYGHEPSNLFATRVAKYFGNGIREEALLAIARAGVVFAPGSAGTMQEIFQDLTQNHYATYGARSPMVLLGSQRYAREHALLEAFIGERGMTRTYGDMVALLDTAEQVVAFIKEHPPRPGP